MNNKKANAFNDHNPAPRHCKRCGAKAFSYDSRKPFYEFIVLREGICTKCKPDRVSGFQKQLEFKA